MTQEGRDVREPGTSVHVPVMLREVIQHLDLQPGQIVVDGTIGGGGHSRQILALIGPSGVLIGLDRDPQMLKKASAQLTQSNCHLRQASYAQLPEVMREIGIDSVDRVLLDLGLSSDQLADESRGFSFSSSGPLDLRFDATSGHPAWKLISQITERELANLLKEYGEERFSSQIAKSVVFQRKDRPIRTAGELVDAVNRAIPSQFAKSARRHPATRVFQALRIAVNDELGQLKNALAEGLPDSLKTGGRAVVITFHSLEDRLVKEAFRGDARWNNLTRKPVTATPAEQRINPRSRSAKLRAAKRI